MIFGFWATLGKTLTSIRPFLRLVSVFSMIGIVVLGLSNCQLSKKLTQAQHQNEQQLEEIGALRQALVEQNESIDRLFYQTEQARIKGEAAVEAARVHNRNLTKIIKEIREMKPVTCEDTAALVAKAIEGLKDE